MLSLCRVVLPPMTPCGQRALFSPLEGAKTSASSSFPFFKVAVVSDSSFNATHKALDWLTSCGCQQQGSFFFVMLKKPLHEMIKGSKHVEERNGTSTGLGLHDTEKLLRMRPKSWWQNLGGVCHRRKKFLTLFWICSTVLTCECGTAF